MKKIAIVYYSKNGTTDALAKAVAHGAESKGAKVYSHRILGPEIVEGRFRNDELFEKLLDMDAIIFGAPTYMGGPAAQFKAFADSTSNAWSEQQWKNKLAAGFTIGSSPCGELQSTIEYMFILASQHSMLWAGIDAPVGTDRTTFNRLNASMGVVALDDQESGISPIDASTATRLGERIATLQA
ncbi:flavodoxin family protein [Enterovibrio sp. ZSDZ35]|uniref:Flavodoxin family protein n=1 Tax=Enterovibrio qingdaonensis TaxID=2899818 RepID=A0ABT5QTB3_9GAMM|nr:flavodoxin family protein [Enterovibrio sp. ZSDZ35]MDD1784221.1 flavodoxin family protein [Enterovibrio sp. ZSDZ35]